MLRKPIAIICLLTIVSFATASYAAPIVNGTTIGVDFGPTAATNNFNVTGSGSNSGSIATGTLIDTSGVTVDVVGFEWTKPGGWSNNDSTGSTDLSGQPAIFNDSNLTDWIGENSSAGNLKLTFTGLDDDATYNLVIGSGFIANGTNVDTIWFVDGQSKETQHDDGALAYVYFNGLSTDGAGNLVIDSAPGAGNTSNITVVSALGLTAVIIPEPSTIILAALGLTGVCFRRPR
ncbi:MAG: PEP-CTERM sorting domain-containing protein [Lentisphaeria bacterium]|nr:PEP-CTERM sorting domain-containing protein [Lentisphaeria bacterium]